MENRIAYERLNEKNYSPYEAFILDNDTSDAEQDFGIGIKTGGVPSGVVFLQKADDTLVVRSIILSDAGTKAKTRTEIFKALISVAHSKGYKNIACRYTDDDPGLDEEFLRSVGFKKFKEEARVYRVNAITLGMILKDEPVSVDMRYECERIIKEGRAECFSEVPEDVGAKFDSLNPAKSFSFMIRNKAGAPESYSAVSQMPDGSLYLADVFCKKARENDLLGLLYMSLGKVFMSIEPLGEFYIAAVNERLVKLAEMLFSTVKEKVDEQKVLLATYKLTGK